MIRGLGGEGRCSPGKTSQPARGGCGDPAGMPVPENTDPRSGGGIWRITCNSLVPCAPSCTFFPSFGSSPDGVLCTCSPADVAETSELPAAPAVVLSGESTGKAMALGGGQEDSMALPPLPAPPPPPGAGEGSHSGTGDLHCSDHAEPCSSRDGHGVPQPCPSEPLGEGSLLLLLPLLGSSRVSPSLQTASPGWRDTVDERKGAVLVSATMEPRCSLILPCVPARLSSSQSRGVAQICCGLAAAAGLGFR